MIVFEAKRKIQVSQDEIPQSVAAAQKDPAAFGRLYDCALPGARPVFGTCIPIRAAPMDAMRGAITVEP